MFSDIHRKFYYKWSNIYMLKNLIWLLISIKDWNWAQTIPSPFIWISDPITLSKGGNWELVADFTEDGQVVLSIPVTFNVLPESAIGTIALIGASIIVFIYWSCCVE